MAGIGNTHESYSCIKSGLKKKYGNVLITGGLGFIGTNLIEHLLDNDLVAKIWNVDCESYASSQYINEKYNDDIRYEHVKTQIQNLDVVQELDDLDLDLILHVAADSHVDNSINTPVEFIKNNIDSTLAVLELCRKYNIQTHIVSTDEIYGEISDDTPAGIGRFQTDSPTIPSSPYSASKGAGDCLALGYARTYDLPITISRCTNNFGLHQHNEKMIPKIIKNIIKGTEIPVYGDGKQTREWTHVSNHINGILKIVDDYKEWKRCQLMDKERFYSDEDYVEGTLYFPYKSEMDRDYNKNIDRIFNVSGGKCLTNLKLIELIADILKLKSKIKHIEDRKGHDRRYEITQHSDIMIHNEIDWYIKFIDTIKVISNENK